ncbi:MAG: GNAT family N-acetyltransferase [Solirubrobacterales bacterium]
MGGQATSERDELLAFELGLDERVCDEVRRESWGRLFLSPSLPLIWDANWAAIEDVGLGLAEVVAVAEEALGGAGCAHRTVGVLDAAQGRALGERMEADAVAWPGWEVERNRYMVWRGGDATSSQKSSDSDEKCERGGGGVREARLAEIEALRRRLIGESMPPAVDEFEATVDQLLAQERRYGAAAGDRWFASPAAGEPLSACCLFRRDGIAQVEEVATRRDARGRGHAKAVVLAAVAAAMAAGDRTVFLTADAADWPQLMYAELGFETVGDITILRRAPARST